MKKSSVKRYLEESNFISKAQFINFISELSDLLDYKLMDFERCPYEDHESYWHDKDGWNPPKWCNVSFSKDYEGEVDQHCDPPKYDCWIHWVMDMFDIKLEEKNE